MCFFLLFFFQIGEYLITLPQHLEPFLSQENAILIRTLSVTEPSEYGSLLSADNGGYANTFLSTIARGVCNSYCEHILSIRELSTLSCKQLAIDIGMYPCLFMYIFIIIMRIRYCLIVSCTILVKRVTFVSVIDYS